MRRLAAADCEYHAVNIITIRFGGELISPGNIYFLWKETGTWIWCIISETSHKNKSLVAHDMSLLILILNLDEFVHTFILWLVIERTTDMAKYSEQINECCIWKGM